MAFVGRKSLFVERVTNIEEAVTESVERVTNIEEPVTESVETILEFVELVTLSVEAVTNIEEAKLKSVENRAIKLEAMIYDLYSRRHNPPKFDVFVYDEIPQKLRVQFVHIIRDLLNDEDGYESDAFGEINDIICREEGFMSLPTECSADDYYRSFVSYARTVQMPEKFLDLVEASFYVVGSTQEVIYPVCPPDIAIRELNERFKQNGVGYQYENGQVIRVDSQFVHAEVVKPALQLLSEPDYAGASEEFLKAHEHYRHGRYKECLVDALKAFESTMKTICDKRGWAYDSSRGAKNLIKVCLDNGLLPSFSEQQLNALALILESGAPTVRNKLGGHGQGTNSIAVPQGFASFALHSAAANILLLIEAEKTLN